MDFLSADGFPITVDGAVEFRVIPERVAEVFVKYNEDDNGDAIDEEIIRKIITPESRSLCRIGGSKLTGGQFISGDDREKFQRELVRSLTQNCQKQGIEILAVAITSIQPPEEIAGPVRLREVAKQELLQYQQERLQQLSEAQLRVQVILADQKHKLVEAEQSVVEKTTRAEQDQGVAVTLAEQKLKVAETQLEAAKDQATAIVAKATAQADVIRFNNKAELAGLSAPRRRLRGRRRGPGPQYPDRQARAGVPDHPVELGRPAHGAVRSVHPARRRSDPRSCRHHPGEHDHAPTDTDTDTGTGYRDGQERGGAAMNRASIKTIGNVLGLVALVYLVGYLGIWQWTICRIEVPPGQSLLLQYKGPWPFGSVPQAPEGTLAQVDRYGRPLQVGVLERMPGPGRHFYSPLEFKATLVKDLIIEPGKVGVVVAKFGKPLPSGTYLVDAEGYRGIRRKVLTPGRYRLNGYAYDVNVVGVDACVEPATRVRRREKDLTFIPPGYVGVVTNKTNDPRTGQVQGIQKEVLQPGIYFLNPVEKRVDVISVGYTETTLMVETERAGRRERRRPARRPAGQEVAARTGVRRRQGDRVSVQ